MLLFNPTGGEIRKDSAGDGTFGSKRLDHLHRGIDLTIPSDNVWSPIEGYVERYAYPYSTDAQYKGLYIKGTGRDLPFNVKMFYFIPEPGLVGTDVSRGQRIGTPAKISERYPDQGMVDHIHLEVTFKPFMLLGKDGSWNLNPVHVNPAILLGIDTYSKR